MLFHTHSYLFNGTPGSRPGICTYSRMDGKICVWSVGTSRNGQEREFYQKMRCFKLFLAKVAMNIRTKNFGNLIFSGLLTIPQTMHIVLPKFLQLACPNLHSFISSYVLIDLYAMILETNQRKILLLANSMIDRVTNEKKHLQ